MLKESGTCQCELAVSAVVDLVSLAPASLLEKAGLRRDETEKDVVHMVGIVVVRMPVVCTTLVNRAQVAVVPWKVWQLRHLRAALSVHGHALGWQRGRGVPAVRGSAP